MMNCLKGTASLLFAIVLLSSCSEAKSSEETTQVKTMDSTSRVLEEQTAKLEEQTEKVAASIEKMEKEFESGNK